jgi:hypothetical protein
VKQLFFLLLAANIGFGAYIFVKERAPNPDAQLLRQQMNADQVTVIAPRSPRAPAPPAGKDSGAAATQVQACIELGSFNAADVARIQPQLEAMGLAERLVRTEVAVSARYWVYIPPLKTREEMDRKAAQLAKFGVSEFFTLTEPGEWRYAISLGIFRSEEGSRKYLEVLRQAGVRSARVAEREQRIMQTAYRVRQPTGAESQKLVALAAEYPGAEIKAINCEAR